jgi:hypothetical protein
MNLVEYANGTFTKRELERLIAYRAAVAAGFYTDQEGSVDPADTHVSEPVETVETTETVEPAETAESKPAVVEAGATPEPPAR